jgi:hypothetical protein
MQTYDWGDPESLCISLNKLYEGIMFLTFSLFSFLVYIYSDWLFFTFKEKKTIKIEEKR